jgi:hypothetical protein
LTIFLDLFEKTSNTHVLGDAETPFWSLERFAIPGRCKTKNQRLPGIQKNREKGAAGEAKDGGVERGTLGDPGKCKRTESDPRSFRFAILGRCESPDRKAASGKSGDRKVELQPELL